MRALIKIGSLYAVGFEGRNSTRKRWQKKRNEMIRQLESPPGLLNWKTGKTRELSMKRHAKSDARRGKGIQC